MATKTRKSPARKPAARKAAAAKRPVAATESAPSAADVRASFNGYKSGDYSKYCKGKHIRLNETGIELISDADSSSLETYGAQTDRFNRAFATSSERWEADASYGLQHYNKEGFMHRNGLTRLPDSALAALIVQAGEELAQRAAMPKDAVTSKINPQVAANHINGISTWLKARPAMIRENRRQQAYATVEASIGGTNTLQLKTAEA